jgi:hypothetical protein
MRVSTSASQASGIMISVAMNAARSAPRSKPANGQDFVAEAAADEARKRVPTLEHGVDRFGDRGRAQQAGAVRSGALLLADAQPLFRGKAVDATLEIEHGVDTPDRLQRDRRDRGRGGSASLPRQAKAISGCRGNETNRLSWPNNQSVIIFPMGLERPSIGFPHAAISHPKWSALPARPFTASNLPTATGPGAAARAERLERPNEWHAVTFAGA